MKSVDEVRKLIVSAFTSVPIPKSSDLTVGRSGGKMDSQRGLRKALAGKHWSTLTDRQLAPWWTMFLYLTSDGYRHYLPAMLVKALDYWTTDKGVEFATLDLLTPLPQYLYFEGVQHSHEHRVKKFTDEQYAAVGAYLGLFLGKDEDWIAIRAARAFQWGWDRVGCDETYDFLDFSERMRHWTPSAPADPEAADLVREIREAFDHIAYPGDDNLCDCTAGESATCAMDLLGTNWRTLHPSIVDINAASLNAMPNDAFHYFLPGFLIAHLCRPNSKSGMEILLCLLHGFARGVTTDEVETIQNEVQMGLFDDDNAGDPRALADAAMTQAETERRSVAVDRFSPFDQAERRAVIRYLELASARFPDVAADIDEALSSYWRPSIHAVKHRGSPARGSGRKKKHARK